MANEFLVTTMEQFSSMLPTLYEMEAEKTLYGQLKGVKAEQITRTYNNRDFRLAFEKEPGGTFGAFNSAGGTFAGGKTGVWDQFYQTYFEKQMAFRMNLHEVWQTDSKKTGMVNAFKDTMKKAIPGFKWYNDASLHNITGNQGLIALGTAYDAGVLTCDVEFGANLAQVGQRVEVFSNNLQTHRTTGLAYSALPYVAAADKDAGTITLDGLGSVSPTATDYLAFPGVGASPAWENGLYYFNTTATSGTLLGANLATIPEIRPSKVNASGSALVTAHGYQLHAKRKQRRGAGGEVMGIISMAQAFQIYEMGLAIGQLERKNGDGAIDPGFKVGDSVTFCGVKHLIDIRQSKKRLDWIEKKNWYRVYRPTNSNSTVDFYRQPSDGQMIFPVYDTNGNRLAAIEFHLLVAENYGCADPGSNSLVYNLSIPQGF